MIEKLNRLLFLAGYRVRGSASKVVVEEYENTFYAVYYPLMSAGLLAVFSLVGLADIHLAASIGSGFLIVVFAYTVVVHTLATYYYATEPTEADAEWVMTDA